MNLKSEIKNLFVFLTLINTNSHVNTKLFFLVVLIVFNCSILSAQQASPQTDTFDVQKVVPNNYETTNGINAFLGPYANTQITYQLIIAASQLTDLVGKNLVSISFRSTFNANTTWPEAEATFINYDIYLGQAVHPANRTLFFAQNAIGLISLVRSGNLVVPMNALTIGANPNSFSYDLSFSTPYFYSGGNLLVEIRHFGTPAFARRVDSVNPQTPGYGTLFSACWYPSNTTSINSAFEDNFSIVNFKAVNLLNTSDFNKNDIKIFPNAVSENLTIESNTTISRVKFFNLVGQLILAKELNQKICKLDLSQFAKGTYLLSVENEFGSVTKKVIKN